MPDVLNPEADSQYAATQQHRADVEAVQQLITTAESSKPDEKAAMLGQYGLDAGKYAQLKMAASYPLNEEDKAAVEKQRQEVEGPGADIQAEDLAHDPISVAISSMVGAKPLMEGGESALSLVPQAIQKVAGTAAAQTAVTKLTDAAQQMFPNHPQVAGLIGTLAGIALLGGTAKVGGPGAEAAPEGTPAPEEPAGSEKTPEMAIPEAKAEPTAEGAAGAEEGTPKEEQPSTVPSTSAVPSDVHSDLVALQDARQNPMTREEMQGIEVEGEEGHQLPVQPLSYSDLVRAQTYTGQVADSVVSAQKRFNLTGSDEDSQALDAAKEELNAVRPQMKAIWHQAGLTLQKVGATDPSSAQIRAVFEAMEQNQTAPERMAMALSNLPGLDQRNKLVETAAAMDGNNWTKAGALYKIYVNSILSLNSAAKKAVSDTASIIMQIPVRGLAEAGSRAWELGTGQDYGSLGVAPGETLATIRGMMDNWSDALKIGLDSAREGKPMFEGDVGFFDNPTAVTDYNSVMGGSGFENTWWGRAVDYYGHLVSIPGRAIIGVDQFSKSMQYNMELNALAQRQGQIEALGEGATGSELSARASALALGYIDKTPGWMSDQAMNTAKVNTFQEDLQGSLAKLDAWRQSNYLTRTLMPFFKTPVNITLQGIRQSPLAPMSGVWRDTMAQGGPEAAIAASKTALGSAIVAYFAYHVLKGNITGGVPPNLKGTAREDWLVDHDAYSIRSGPESDTRWTSYEGLEPLSWLLGMTADAAPAFSYLSDGETSHAVGVLARAAVNEIGRQPMWGALHQLVNSLDDIERGKTTSIGQLGSRMAAGLIPSSAANLAGGIDPIRRQTQDFVSTMRNRIPWLKEDGLPTYDSFARPNYVPPGFMWNEFPAYVSTKMKQADPVVDEMSRLNGTVGFQPPQIPKAIGGPADSGDMDSPTMEVYGASLTPAERNQWMEMRADPQPETVPKLYDAVSSLMKSDEYQEASDAQRANILHEVFTGYQHMAQGRLLAANDSVRGRVMAAYADKVRAHTMGRTASIAAP